MAADWTMKQHDRKPSIQATLSVASGTVDLTGCTVKFIMAPAAGGTATVNSTAVIVTATSPAVVRYDWALGDTATIGSFNAEWQVTDSGGKEWTFPTATYHSISIVADLDGA